MSATPQRETYPLVSSDDTLMMVFRDHHLSSSRPLLYIKALTDAQIRVDSAPDVDSRPVIKVVDYAKGAGNTITITVNGAPTVLTEGVNFTAATSNLITAINISAAVSTIAGITTNVIDNEIFLISDATVNTLEITTNDPQAWIGYGFTVIGTPQSLISEQEVSINLPTGVFDPLNKVCILNVISGKVSADLRSFSEVRTYFRMPTSLAPTTGQPGGWPVNS